MAEKIILGKVLVTLEGEHDSTRSYDKYCEVTSGGSSFVSKKDVPIGTPITDTTYWQKRASKGADGIDGTDGNDGLDAYQPFKGWYSDTTELNTSFGSPVVGDYAYVKGASASDPVTIYQCTTAGTWVSSGRTFNPSNNQEFASGEALNVTRIVDNLNSSSATDVLSAKQGKVLDEKIGQLGPKIAKALPRDTAEDGLWICDASGKALLRLDTLDTKGGVGTNLAATIKDLIESAAADGLTTIEASAIGETLTSLIQELIEEYAPTPTPSGGGNIMEVEEDGFYICNGNGQVIASWIDGEWDFGQGGGGGDEGCPKYVSALAGMDGGKVKKDMAANEELQMTDYPRDEKKGTQLMFGGKITSTFSSVRLGRKTAHDYAYVEVDGTNITIKKGSTSTSYYIATAAHGLTISTMVNVNFAFKNDGQVRSYVQTLGGGFEFAPMKYDRVSNGETVSTNVATDFYGTNGVVFAETIGTAMTGCQLSAHNPNFKCPIWLFGDSYFGVGSNRWIGVMHSLGYFNFYLNGLSGRASTAALADVNRALKFGCPKYLLFALITNDYSTLSAFKSNVDSLISICKEKGITPIFATQGGLPNKDYKPHCEYIISKGVRYIDFAHEVATNGWESDSTWYDGLLFTDNVHPTPSGAKALAMRALKDMPELLQCVGGLE